MKKNFDNDKLTLYFLAWQDCIDRLDTLLLETRHLQQNIIYNLRSPLLYRPLRYEEKFLWDKDAFCDEKLVKAVNEKGCDLKTLTDKLADKAIILYPLPKHKSERKIKNKFGLKEEIEKQLENYIEKVLLQSKWSTDQRRHYHNLYALQKIKRNIFSDKLLTCQEGFYAFGIFPNKSTDEMALPQFMILRSAILHRIWNYVERLGDHQEEFSKSLDMGLQDHPRPSMERRREQRIYTTYLSQRCIDLWLEIKMLVGEKLDKNQKKLRRPSILHRWHHKFTSNAYSFFDDVADTIDQEEWKNRDEKKLTPYSHYINTSYFMPDRPNLQSLIAHEVAHSFLKDYFDDLSRQQLNLKKESFFRLIKQLGQCMDVYGATELLNTLPDAPVKEIAVDLLASAVKGPAYLYALFLEITGTGLENLLFMGKYSEIELKLFDYLDGAGGQYDQEREWYIRLSVVCAWLDEIFKGYDVDSPRTLLAKRLIKGIQDVLDDMLDYLDDIARPPKKWKSYWQSLKKRMCTLIRQSNAPARVRQWWKERNEDYENGNRFLPVYTYPLNEELRAYLIDCFKSRKYELAKDLRNNRSNEEIMNKCKEVYGLKDSDLSEKGNLFKHIYDISWQSAFLDGLDCIHSDSILKPSNRIDWINRLHQFAVSTRKIYQIALDFYIGHIDYFPYLRLREVVILLNDENFNDKLKELDNKNNKDFLNKISQWMQKTDFNIEKGFTYESMKDIDKENIDNLKEKITDIFKEKRINESINLLANKYDALFFLKSTYTLWEPKEKQILSRIILEKLERLYSVFNDDVEWSKKDNHMKILEPLFTYLKITHFKTQSLYGIKKDNSDDFFSEIMNAMSVKDKDDKERYPIKQYIIGRVSLGSAYRIHDKREPFIKLTRHTLDKIRKIGNDFINISDKLEEKLNHGYKIEDSVEDILKIITGEKKFNIYNNRLLKYQKKYLNPCSILTRISNEAKREGNDLISIADELEKSWKNSEDESEEAFRNDLKEVIKKAVKDIGEELKNYYASMILKLAMNDPKNPKNRFYIDDLFNKDLKNDTNHNGFQMKSLLGRYDFIIYGPTRMQGHYWLPLFQQKDRAEEEPDSYGIKAPQCEACTFENGFIKSYPQFNKKIPYQDEENFFPFFIRWEYASPIRLRKESWTDTNKEHPIALISVVLKHSISRLYFLYRLLSVSREDNELKDKKPINLEQLKGYFQDGDRAFLSDGWEDVLIMLSGKPERVEDIFTIQKVLFEDFQVERTELILMPKALDYVLCNEKHMEKVRIEVLYRLLGDWGLTEGFDSFVKTFKENIQFDKMEKFENLKACIKTYGLPFEKVLSRIPGRMDYLLWLYPMDTKKAFKKFQKLITTEQEKIFNECQKSIQSEQEKIFDEYKKLIESEKPILHRVLIELLKDTRVDRVQTNMGWRGEEENS